MSFKTVLVHADPGPGCNRRVRLAARVAGMFDAALFGIGAEALETAILSGDAMFDGAVLEAIRERVATELPAAEKHFYALSAGVGAVSWLAEEGYPDRMLALHARGADLIVVSRPGREESAPFAARVADVVMQSGAPVLVAADNDLPLSGARVIVGWKDTRESRRALSDAMPFLVRAQKVVVVAVSGEEDGGASKSGLSEVAERLARQGVKVSTEIVAKGPGVVADVLEAVANHHSADLIVAGAYARSRLREWFLGGVTEDLVAASSKYVLLSH